MQNFNFNHLYYFHVVATEGSLAAAAKELNVTQPTISEQIKQLEGFLQAKLFDRRAGGGLRLNEAGRRVYDHTSVMFRTSNRLLQRFRSDAQHDRAVIDIGVAASVSRTFAARFFLPLFELGELMPRVRSGDHDYLLHELVTMELDLLLTDSPPRDAAGKGLEARAVHAPRMIMVARPDLATDDLSQLSFIAYTAASPYRWEFFDHFHALGIDPRVIGEADDVALMVTAAREGLCAAVVPDTVAEQALADGALTTVAEITGFESRVWAVYHSKETPQRVLDAIDRLTQPSVAALS